MNNLKNVAVSFLRSGIMPFSEMNLRAVLTVGDETFTAKMIKREDIGRNLVITNAAGEEVQLPVLSTQKDAVVKADVCLPDRTVLLVTDQYLTNDQGDVVSAEVAIHHMAIDGTPETATLEWRVTAMENTRRVTHQTATTPEITLMMDGEPGSEQRLINPDGSLAARINESAKGLLFEYLTVGETLEFQRTA